MITEIKFSKKSKPLLRDFATKPVSASPINEKRKLCGLNPIDGGDKFDN